MIDFSRVKSVADITRVQAQDRPDAVAVEFNGRTTTFRELDERASRVAQGLLEFGQKPGARIGYLGKNMDRYYEVLFGAFKTRAVVVGVNWRLAPPEIAYVLNDAGCEVIFVGRDFYTTMEKVLADCPKLKHVVAMDGGHATWPSFEDWRNAQPPRDPMLTVSPDDDVIQLYTSGTTGHPKGVQLTSANYLAVFEAVPSIGLGYVPEDVVLQVMPLFHVAGVNMGIFALAQGARCITMADVDPPQILRFIVEKNVTHALLVPAVILFVLQQPGVAEMDFSRLKSLAYGASPISDEVLLRAQRTFGCEFVQLYGLTETLGAGTYLPPHAHDPARGKLRSCGIPVPGVEIKVVDGEGREVKTGEVGEIVIRGRNIMKGYWNKPEATQNSIRDGWFSSGDAGFFDADGYLYIHDRVKDMIVSGGENIYPAEVENAIFGHPAVADVAVIGVPDERWGEAVKAIVVKKPDSDVIPADIIAWARERIAGYKLPKSVDFIEALPRNPSGKILRRELREPYWKGQARRVN